MSTPINRGRSTNSLEGMLPPPDVEGVAVPGGVDDTFVSQDHMPFSGKKISVNEFHQQNRLSVDQTQRNVRNLQSQLEQLVRKTDDLTELINAPVVEEEEAQIKLQEGANITITQRGNTFIISSSASASAAATGDTYEGHFNITYDADEDEIDVAAGVVVNGTTVSVIAASSGIDVSGDTYLSIEIWFSFDGPLSEGSWKTAYLNDSSYPTQDDKDEGGDDFPCLRVLIAEKVSGSWVQQQFGEIHNTRLT